MSTAGNEKTDLLKKLAPVVDAVKDVCYVFAGTMNGWDVKVQIDGTKVFFLLDTYNDDVPGCFIGEKARRIAVLRFLLDELVPVAIGTRYTSRVKVVGEGVRGRPRWSDE